MPHRVSLVPVTLLLLAACTSMEPLHRGDPDVPLDLVARAGASDESVDAAALLVLVELALRSPDQPVAEETLATAIESLGRRAAAETLSPSHRELAGLAAAELVLDELRDPGVRMSGCDLLARLQRVELLQRVAEEAIDPLVAEHATEALENVRSGPSH